MVYYARMVYRHFSGKYFSTIRIKHTNKNTNRKAVLLLFNSTPIRNPATGYYYTLPCLNQC